MVTEKQIQAPICNEVTLSSIKVIASASVSYCQSENARLEGDSSSLAFSYFFDIFYKNGYKSSNSAAFSEPSGMTFEAILGAISPNSCTRI